MKWDWVRNLGRQAICRQTSNLSCPYYGLVFKSTRNHDPLETFCWKWQKKKFSQACVNNPESDKGFVFLVLIYALKSEVALGMICTK